MSAPDSSMPSFRDFAAQIKSYLVGPKALSPNQPILIFGTGQFGRDVCQILRQRGYDVVGFIETKPKNQTASALPVWAWEQLSKAQLGFQIVIGIYNRGMPLDQLEAIARSHGVQEVFFPWDLYDQFGANLGWRYWLGSQELLTSNLDSIERSFNRLSDPISRQCLLDICRFRLGALTSYASFQHTENQYFNPLTLANLHATSLTYVDGGAYNGDTVLELHAAKPVRTAYLFEPDPSNFDVLVRNTAHLESRITCLPLALADRHQILSFNAGTGEGAAISEHGTTHITAVALDDVMGQQHIDFLKLDVEGAEVAALQGAEKMIQRCRPVMALSLYHRPQDIWAIPDQIAEIADGYDLYIRQHYANSFDSVLYAVAR